VSRSNRRERVFFGDDDFRLYRDVAGGLRQGGRRRLGLLPDAQPRPSDPDAGHGRRAGAGAGQGVPTYSVFVNARLRAAARTVARNPVRARLVERAEDWPWSSVRAHLEGRDDGLVDAASLLSRAAGRFADLLDEEPDAETLAALRAAEGIGRPLGAKAFLDRLAGLTGRDPRPGKRGRKPKRAADAII
jgi:putative transposase